MKTKIFLIVVIVLSFVVVQEITSIFATNVAQAQVPVGGLAPAVLQSPCNGGLLYMIVGPAPSLVFSVAPIIGRNQLGSLPPATVPCILGIIPMGVGILAPPPGPTWGFGP